MKLDPQLGTDADLDMLEPRREFRVWNTLEFRRHVIQSCVSGTQVRRCRRYCGSASVLRTNVCKFTGVEFLLFEHIQN